MKKILTLFGTRPEAIKMLPLILELKKTKEFDTIVCVSGQHRDMLDQVLNIFQLKATYDLNIMTENQSLTDITLRTLAGMEKVLRLENPDLILVHGDTQTTFAGSLSAFYHQIPVAHVEAGLRTNCMYDPFPEEMNRLLTDRLSTLYFAPTNTNRENLLKENIDPNKIFVCGNTVIDAFPYTINKNHLYTDPVLRLLKGKQFVLITAHRRENLGEGIRNICLAIKELAKRYTKLYFVYPVHKNPLLRKTVFSILDSIPNVKLCEPLDVCDMHNAMNDSYFIMTDSGGLQEEAPSLRKPVLVLRNTTERPEGIKSGNLKLTGTKTEDIVKAALELFEDHSVYQSMAVASNPFGDGKASMRVTQIIRHFFNSNLKLPEEFQ